MFTGTPAGEGAIALPGAPHECRQKDESAELGPSIVKLVIFPPVFPAPLFVLINVIRYLLRHCVQPETLLSGCDRRVTVGGRELFCPCVYPQPFAMGGTFSETDLDGPCQARGTSENVTLLRIHGAPCHLTPIPDSPSDSALILPPLIPRYIHFLPELHKPRNTN